MSGAAVRRAAADLLVLTLEKRRTLDEAMAASEPFGALDGSDRGFARAIASAALRELGRIDLALQPLLTRPLQAVTLVAEERTVKGSYIGSCVPSRDVPRYIALYRAGKLPVDKLMSARIALDDINAGFDRLASGEAVRQVIVF